MTSGGQAPASICVFAGSRAGSDPRYAATARALVRAIARRGLGIVYGAGNVGLMGVVAEEALRLGVPVVGVVPWFLVEREVAHGALDERIVVDTMLERKQIMAERSIAFVTLPGGLGTLDELFEVVTWSQLRVHDKPCGLLNVGGYWDPLLAMLERAVGHGFLDASPRELLRIETDPDALLEQLLGSTGP